jgi:membrane protein required for colicin V production
MNWIDWLLIGILLASVVAGLAQGFVKIVIGSMALIVGFFFASWFHGVAGGWLEPWVQSKAAASFIGFVLIFGGMVVLGSLIAWVIQRIFKVVGLNWIDRLVGGAFGAVRGILVLAITALLVSAFFPKRMPAAVSHSQLAPYVFNVSRVLSEMTPYEIKNGFEQTYHEFTVLLEGIRRNKRLPGRRE